MLKTKGKAVEQVRGSYTRYYVYIDDRLFAETKVSHDDVGDVGKPLGGKIARQLGLNWALLEQFVDCTFSGEDFEAYLRQTGPVRFLPRQ